MTESCMAKHYHPSGYCTLPKDHDGDHEAHFEKREPIKWKQEKKDEKL